MDGIPVLTDDAVRRLTEMLERSEAAARSTPDLPGSGPRRPNQPHGVLLKITGSVSSGLYPAKLSTWDDVAGAEILSAEVRWKPRDGSTPASGDYVWGQFTGPTAAGDFGLYHGTRGGPAVTSATITYLSDATVTATCNSDKTITITLTKTSTTKTITGAGLTIT